MKRHEVITSLFIPIIEMSGIIGIFFIAYYLRQITDGIPFIQLPIPYISPDQFLPFILSWACLWWVIFAHAGLYRYDWEQPLIDIIRRVIIHAGLWFLFYVAFVYLSIGFIFVREIPRLIIGYVWILSTLFAISIRIALYTLMSILYSKRILSQTRILVIDSSDHQYSLKKNISSEYTYINSTSIDEIYSLIREKKVDIVLSLTQIDELSLKEIIRLCSIYWVSYSYPRIPQYVYDISHQEGFIAGIPVVSSSALAMSAWDRITKRTLDIVLSSIGLIVLSPLFLIIMLAVKIEDSAWPAIYKNKRIWIRGKEFSLYKFRYMYWKYCVKDAYGVSKGSDTALEYEEKLREKADTRDGPLYKIQDDPRKTYIGYMIERLSLDELPQLWNVLRWDMSLVWPRPHQPREVALYREYHHQVLTVKPGITGMAQVSGREKNSFDEEVAYDIYYIEHYSILLDLLIIGKTIGVIIVRAFR